ncbi:stress protein DDR48-like isoform X2 [Bradysia coprophila]|uniref:stress protein DDR48-like isoform X2 n=1 Tax=Bradysia coprophila TaxID=38358 RepID=UPI00187DD191|nr:stress protein DDR48-like isoform X2 [Bradysia coprophila]
MYYHYTNGSGAKAISQSGNIQPSGESGSFGPGVYLTDLDPNDFFRDEILRNNYGVIRSNFRNRADWVVAVFEKNINKQLLSRVHVPGDRRIFVYPTSIPVTASQIYDKPRCFKAFTDCEADTFSSDGDHDSDSTDDGSVEFDTDDVLSDSDEIAYSGEDEEIEEIDEHQTDDDTFSNASAEERNGYSEYDSNGCEGTSAEEESYENASGEEDSYEDPSGVDESQCYSEVAEQSVSDGSEEDCNVDEYEDDCEYDNSYGYDDDASYCYNESDDDSY